MERSDAHFVECMPLSGGTASVGDYPTLQVADGTFATQYADPGLTHTTAIANVTDLQNMNNNKAGNYYLTGDIDASATSGWNAGAGFLPVGTSVAPFTGTFDGCDYTISDLFINRTTTNTGLFGHVHFVSIVNVTLTSCNITGKASSLGSLVGSVESTVSGASLIQNCHASGTVSGSGAAALSDVGGLIGLAAGGAGVLHVLVQDCTTSCTVDVETLPSTWVEDVGGFIGYAAEATFYNCRSSGQVTATSYGDMVGGFIGDVDGTYLNDVIIEDCSATGDVSGYDDVGGFAGLELALSIERCSARGDVYSEGGTCGGFTGYMAGTVYSEHLDCYAWGNVSGIDAIANVGGFVGYISSSTPLENLYSIGTTTIIEGATEGGFVAYDDGPATFTSCFWDTDSSLDSTSSGGVGHITFWMKTQSNYETAGWDFNTVWEMDVAISQYGINGSTVYGFNHLIGETVKIMADGVVQVEQIVSDAGTITLSSTPSVDVVLHIGLAYESKLKPMKPVSQPDMMKAVVTCKQIGISVHNTDDIKYGVHDDDMKAINFDDVQWKNKCEIDGLFTGSVCVSVPDGFSVNLPLQITTDAPLPCTVRAMIPKVD